MISNNQEKQNKNWALSLSIGLHILLLLCAYYVHMETAPVGQSAARSITLTTYVPQERVIEPSQAVPSSNQASEQTIETSQTGKVKALTTNQASQDAAVKEKPEEPAIPEPDQAKTEPTPIEAENLQTAIDERGLYQSNQEKQAGASLELVGWTWDTIPQPDDTTSETGKLVFEITIDDLGEVIAVKTLEKTLSPLVEQLYKDAVATLTFSKTAKNMAYAPTSVGKVTFIIQTK